MMKLLKSVERAMNIANWQRLSDLCGNKIVELLKLSRISTNCLCSGNISTHTVSPAESAIPTMSVITQNSDKICFQCMNGNHQTEKEYAKYLRYLLRCDSGKINICAWSRKIATNLHPMLTRQCKNWTQSRKIATTSAPPYTGKL